MAKIFVLKIKKDFGKFQKNTIVQVCEKTGKSLLSKGIAEIYNGKEQTLVVEKKKSKKSKK